MLHPSDPMIATQGVATHDANRSFLGCLSSGNDASRVRPPWVQQLVGDLKKDFEESLQLQLSRHEELLQSCLERLEEWHSQDERQNKLDHESTARAKAVERQLKKASSSATAEPKAQESEDLGQQGLFVEIEGRDDDQLTKAVQRAIAPMHADLCSSIERQQVIEQHLLHLQSCVQVNMEPPSPGASWSHQVAGSRGSVSSDSQDLATGGKKVRRPLKGGKKRRSSLNGLFDNVRRYEKDGFESLPTWKRLWRRCLVKLVQWADFLANLHEPPRTGALARFTDSQGFESLCATVIMVNAVFTLMTTNWEMANLKEDPTLLMVLGEIGFLGFYCVELILKLTVHRVFFFSGEDLNWNCFDLALVVFSIYDMTTSAMVKNNGDESGGGVNLTFMRSFRVFKMAKILRAVRAMRFISDLRLMLNSIMGSFTSLFWSFVMLLFIYYIFSLIFVQGCITYLVDEGDDLPEKEFDSIMRYFGSVQVSILSLIQATTGGNDWDVFYKAVSYTGATNAGLFLFFMGFFHIALLNVLTGIFVENAMMLAKPDPYTQALEQRDRELMEAADLKNICYELPEVKSGKLTGEDFERAIQHGQLRAHLKVLGLDIRDARKFFSTLTAASGQDEVDIEAFVDGCMTLKGNATAIELQSLMCETRETAKQVKRVEKLVKASSQRSLPFQASGSLTDPNRSRSDSPSGVWNPSGVALAHFQGSRQAASISECGSSSVPENPNSLARAGSGSLSIQDSQGESSVPGELDPSSGSMSLNGQAQSL